MGTPVGTLLEVVLDQRCNGQQMLNVLHWRNDSVSSENTLDGEYTEISNKIFSAVGGGLDLMLKLLDCQSVDTTVVRRTLQFVYPLRRRRWVDDVIGASGTRTGPPNAQNVHACIGKHGDNADGHNQGSMHIGGLSNSDYAGGLISSALAIPLGVVAGRIKTSFTTLGGATWLPVIRNRITETWLNPYESMTTTIVRTEVRTSRTRTIGKGK